MVMLQFVISYDHNIQLHSSNQFFQWYHTLHSFEYVLGMDKRNGILCEEHWYETPSGDWTWRILWTLDASESSAQPKFICSTGWNRFHQEPPGSWRRLRFCSHLSRLLVSLFSHNCQPFMRTSAFMLISYSYARAYWCNLLSKYILYFV